MYRCVLKSDKKLLDGAITKYTLEDSKNPKTGLDSTLFGANTTRSNVCYVCKNNIENCPGHYSVMELPIPIVKTICKSDCLSLIPCLCPVCSHILIKQDILDEIKKLNPNKRLNNVKELSKQYIDSFLNSLITCPHCQTQISSPIVLETKLKYDFVPIFKIKSTETADYEIINPIYVYNVLQKFTQIEEIGFSEAWHPKNFMTSYIPIIPTKLRAKSMLNGIDTSSAITGYYKIILEDILPELTKIKNYCIDKKSILIDKSQIEDFITIYTLLVAYYMMITDVSSDKTQEKILQLLNEPNKKYKRRFKVGFDVSNCMIQRFKGKEKSIFSKGIIRMIHDVSARMVLGSAVDSPMTDLVVPYDVANSLMIFYPVYKENLQFMKMLCKAMNVKELVNNKFIPKVYGVWKLRLSSFQKLNYNNALTISQLLMPGDKIGISLCNNDFVIQSRHPSIREESLTSFLVRKDIVPTMNIPTSVCEIKQADFDGDECQLYLASSHSTDIESLLLHSVPKQLRSFDNGNLSFFYASAHDDDLGVSRIKNINLNYHNHHKIPTTNVLKLIEDVLPKDLTYHSNSLVIENGKINKDKTDFKLKPFYKYYATIYGEKKCSELIDFLTQIGYEINREYGATLGFEIKFWGSKDDWNKIQELKKNAIKLSSEIIRSHGEINILAVNEIEKIKPVIQDMIVKAAVGQNLEKNNYTKNRASEYYTMIVLPNWVNVGGNPITPQLVEGTRTTCCGYRYSIDPSDYGFVDTAYVYDMKPMSHFFIMMEEMKGIYNRTSGVAKQGYMSNRMTVLFERAFTDYNGCLVDGNTLLSPQYGVCGLDARIEVSLEMKDLKLDKNEFKKKYSDKRLIELHEYINKNIEQYKNITSFISQTLKYTFETGVDFEQIFVDKYKGKTPQNEIDEFIIELYNTYRPIHLKDDILKLEENFIDHEYYFRQKLTEYKLNKELKEMVLLCIKNMFSNAGDPVGIKSALAASAPLTQAALSSIHTISAGGAYVDLVIRPTGLQSFEENIGGGKCKDDIIITIVLIDDSKENCEKFALEQETFYINEIWCESSINISKSIPNELIKSYGKDILKINRHPYYVISTWNMVKISKYNIHISEIIDNIMENYPEIIMMIPIKINESQVSVYIYFKENIDSQVIFNIVQKWKEYNKQNIIHGKYLKNCFVAENVNLPGHYVIEANEMKQIIVQKSPQKTKPKIKNEALQHLILDPRVNPTLCKTTEPNDSIKIFGICEGECRHYDRLLFTAQNLADTSSCLNRVYKTITSVMTARGKLTFATGNSILKDPFADTITSIKFQEAGKFIRNACVADKKTKINQAIPGMMFGEDGKIGTGVSNIILYAK